LLISPQQGLHRLALILCRRYPHRVFLRSVRFAKVARRNAPQAFVFYRANIFLKFLEQIGIFSHRVGLSILMFNAIADDDKFRELRKESR